MIFSKESLEHFLHHYGYWTVLFGTAVEGETVLVLAGFAAHEGYFNISLVILSAFVGGFLADMLFFTLGRWKGNVFLNKSPKLKARTHHVLKWLNRYRDPIAAGSRFFAGFRTVLPLAIGMSEISTMRFVVLKVVGSVIWAVSIAAVGFYLGESLSWFMGDLKHKRLAILLAICVAGLIVALYERIRRRRIDRSESAEG
jgi:membrane protein DedA with SNARE-associated domain